MRIKVKEFTNILNDFMMMGTSEISDGIFTFTEEGFEVKALTTVKTASSKLQIKKEFFTDYEIMENIGIGDLSGFISALKNFKEEIEIKVEGNLLTISEKKKSMEMELVDEKFINSIYQELKIEYTNVFNMSTDILKKIFLSKSVKGNKESTVRIETDVGKIKYTIKGKYKFIEEFEDESILEKSSSTFGVPFFECLIKFVNKESTTKFLQLSIGDSYPLKVIKETDLYKLEIVIAPYDNEDE